MHGTKASAELWLVANWIALLVCRRAVSKLTSVLQPDSTSHNLILESDPESETQRQRATNHWNAQNKQEKQTLSPSVTCMSYILQKKAKKEDRESWKIQKMRKTMIFFIEKEID